MENFFYQFGVLIFVVFLMCLTIYFCCVLANYFIDDSVRSTDKFMVAIGLLLVVSIIALAIVIWNKPLAQLKIIGNIFQGNSSLSLEGDKGV